MQESQGIIDSVRLAQEYWPLVTLGRSLLKEQDAFRKAIIIADACEWLAAKSKSQFDDEAVRLLTETLRTPQGEQLIRWALSKAEALE